jgi:iron-sulfur cluster assembly accessory protein
MFGILSKLRIIKIFPQYIDSINLNKSYSIYNFINHNKQFSDFIKEEIHLKYKELDEKSIILAKSIKITDNCVKVFLIIYIERIKEIINKNNSKKFLRLMVEGGGCSGYQYIFQMDGNINANEDVVLEKNNSQVVIDKLSLPFLEGALIDYKETMVKSSFIIGENPKAEISCSCGTSFSPKSII